MITTQNILGEKPLVLVIGGAGFIGSFLCETLLLQKSRVVCIDNLSTGKKENLNRCLKSPDFLFQKLDLKNLLTLYNQGEVSHIFDLSGSREGLKNLIAIAQKTGAKLLVAGGVKDSWFKDLIRDNPQLDIRVVLLNQVYGPRMAIKTKDWTIMAEQLTALRPVFISDIVYGLTKAMFAGGTSGRVVNLSQADEKINWYPKIDLATGLKLTQEFFSKKKKPAIKVGSLFRKKTSKKFGLIFLALLLLLITPFLLFLTDSWLAVRYLQKTYQAVLAADSFQVTILGNKTEELFSRAANESRRLVLTAKSEKYFLLGKELAAGLTHAGSLGNEANNLIGMMFQGGEVGQTMQNIKTELAEIYFHLSTVESGIKNLPGLKFLAPWKEKGILVRELVLEAQKGIEVLPWMMGLEKKITYLVLLQNNHELRPTGGFIGSYALLTFEKGKLLDFEVQDVYWADGQLKGHVEPPPDLKKYLGEANWYLRDSNWSPDFPTSALRAKWFLEKETGRVVDGVIATNLFFIQELLQATGEIELADFKEKINYQNLFERAEYYAEIGFFPGSTQKQDFLGALSRALFEKLKTNDRKTWTKVLLATNQSLKTKDLLFFLTDTKTRETISELGWDGSVKGIGCLSEKDCYADYLMLVEANVGVNKANFFVTRTLDQQIKFTDNGIVEETLTINYQNDSPSETFPGGSYRNYLRLMTPLGTILVKTSQDDQKIPLEQVDTSEISSKTSFGFLVEVPPGEKKTVEIVYRLPDKIYLKEKTHYLLFLQKQPGTKTESIRVQISPPEEIKILPIKPQAVYENGSYFFSPDFSQDLILEMYLVR